jgi:hypothetical protein
MSSINLLPTTPQNLKSTFARISGRAFTLALSVTLLSCALPAMASSVHADSKKSTKISLKASPSTIKEGQKITITALVTPSKATGDVTFYVVGTSYKEKVPLKGGEVKETVPQAPPGTYKLKAVYDGSSKYSSSTSSTIKVVIKP